MKQLEAGGGPITVLVADDDPVFCAALAEMVQAEPTLGLAGVAEDAEQALALARETDPAVALVDVRMGGGGGMRVARELREAGSSTRVLALSASDDHGTVLEMLEAGAVGYLIKGVPVAALIDAIQTVAGGSGAFSPQVGKGSGADADHSSDPGAPITVLVADDNRQQVEALAELIDADPALELVGLAGDAAEALRLAIVHQPQVALVDWRMPGGGIAAVAAMRERAPSTRVIALSFADERDVVLDMLRAGATSYVVKPVGAEAVTTAIRATAAGGAVLAPEVTMPVIKELVVELQRRQRDSDRVGRERERVRAAIADGLHMHFQPIFDLTTQQAVGVEALARFALEPRRTPEVWFAEAGLVGLGVQLETAAAGQALATLDRLEPQVSLHFNLSPGAVLTGVATTLLRDADPSRLVLEVTEHAEISDYPHLMSVLEPLRERGLRLAVDDFGAGFASLRHVLLLRPDVIKLDVSLCHGIDSDPMRQALAASMVTFSARAGAQVVAEGIEAEGELAVLTELGVTHGQGFLLGRPQTQPPQAMATV
jgi:DNA-binding NarL/FixJ family response regulator/EAL domain-containing protein (putative c-di-GMP-specific phosphodiesterase class I)